MLNVRFLILSWGWRYVRFMEIDHGFVRNTGVRNVNEYKKV